MSPLDNAHMDEELDGWNDAFGANRQALPDAKPSAGSGDAGPAPFRCLGHDRGKYYFLPAGGGQVICMSAKDVHSAPMLMTLAPLSWWEGAFPGGKESFQTRAAGNQMMRDCERMGIFDPDRMRGRGVWIDNGRPVLHLGDLLRVNGQEAAPSRFESRYVYEQARAIDIPAAEPLTDQEARGLLRLCCEVAWEDRDRDGRLLAGWLVNSLICGGLQWRPHMWITGESGEGKSWVFDNIVKPILRHLALEVQGFTTEAGIRGSLGSDALPVIFDEAEPDEEKGHARMQQILHLARQASTEDGGAIVKGTKDGGARQFRIRSTFIFSSINTSLSQAADESRTIVLNMTPAAASARIPGAFETLKATCAEVMTPDFAPRLMARCLKLLPVIRANAETLAMAIARRGNSRRTGDTYGTVLAGTLSLTTDKRLSAQDADAFLDKHTWIGAAAAEAKVEKEWAVALSHLVQAEIHGTFAGRPQRFTVSELIGACLGQTEAMTVFEADQALRRCGMVVRDKMLVIANQSEFVTERFRSTRWAAGWGRTLSRAQGSAKVGVQRFTTAFASRSLGIPLSVLTDDPKGGLG